ncbi:unnamed protein product [Leptosia nina]|uniref:Uncharacterized protein n=1 Tax=Leptosia nina TaxID=320188 RepID=A0AAV1J109_9NEOP
MLDWSTAFNNIESVEPYMKMCSRSLSDFFIVLLLISESAAVILWRPGTNFSKLFADYRKEVPRGQSPRGINSGWLDEASCCRDLVARQPARLTPLAGCFLEQNKTFTQGDSEGNTEIFHIHILK